MNPNSSVEYQQKVETLTKEVWQQHLVLTSSVVYTNTTSSIGQKWAIEIESPDKANTQVSLYVHVLPTTTTKRFEAVFPTTVGVSLLLPMT